MSSRLPAVLSARELPLVELGALRLDGEVFRLDECAVAVDEVHDPALRAAVIAAELPSKLIAERHSAAWVWGAQHEPPVKHEVCADIGARTRPAFGIRYSVREVVIGPEDVVELSAALVTTPLRTAVDLARFVTDWTTEQSSIIAALMRIGHFDVVDCARAMNRRRNLPAKKLALDRISRC